MKKFILISLIICFINASFVSRVTTGVASDTVKSDSENFEYIRGAITRGKTNTKEIALVFTGDEYADGADQIIAQLKKQNISAGFFFTGNFYRIASFQPIIQALVENNHYVGAHSDQHLLYCDWTKRDSLLITQQEFNNDIAANYREMERFGINKQESRYFLPPYEWYNDTISSWTEKQGLQLINFTHGTLSHADYTTPDMPNYRSSEVIYNSILEYEQKNKNGLNGFILLSHIGTSAKRTDKFYFQLEKLIVELKSRGYIFTRIDELLN